MMAQNGKVMCSFALFIFRDLSCLPSFSSGFSKRGSGKRTQDQRPLLLYQDDFYGLALLKLQPGIEEPWSMNMLCLI